MNIGGGGASQMPPGGGKGKQALRSVSVASSASSQPTASVHGKSEGKIYTHLLNTNEIY